MQSKLFGHPVDIERSKFTYNLCRNSMSDYKNISEWTMRGYRTFRRGKEGGQGSTKKNFIPQLILHRGPMVLFQRRL